MGFLKGLLLAFGLLFFGALAFLYSLFALALSPLFPKLLDQVNLVFLKPFGSFARAVVGVKLETLHGERLSGRPIIFFGNHQTGLDLAIIGSTCTEGALIVGKKEIRNIPIFGWFFWIAGNPLIDRKNATKARKQINEVRETLIRRNLNLAIFPEGTRSKDGEILAFKKGIFHLAATTGFPLVPVVCSKLKGKAIWENFELKGGRVIVSVLEPIETKGLDLNHLDSFREQLRNQMIAEYDRINLIIENEERGAHA